MYFVIICFNIFVMLLIMRGLKVMSIYYSAFFSFRSHIYKYHENNENSD